MRYVTGVFEGVKSRVNLVEAGAAMTKRKRFIPQGVIPATLAAFNEDFSLNETQSRKHVREVGATEGISAVTVNGHASEVHACSLAEQSRILSLSLEEVGDRVPLVNGIYSDGSHHAAEISKTAQDLGASALLVFPPSSMVMGGQLRPEMALAHFSTIADSSDLPIILFQYPIGSGLGYPFDTLLALFDKIPTICAIKDWSNDPMLHERHIRTFQNLPKPISVLTTHSSWLMASLTMGANGLLSGAGSIIADMQVALYNAILEKNLSKAESINDLMYPLVQVLYAPPFLDMHNRMKECLVLLGRLDRAIVRPPLTKLASSEIDSLKGSLDKAGLSNYGITIQAAE